MYDYHFSFLDILSPVILLPICYNIYSRIFRKFKGEKNFKLNFFWHLVFSVVFTFLYIIFLGGGDTLAYFNTIKCLNNLALYDFVDYLIQLKEGNEIYKFNYVTGRPPGWIFREEESFFVCQVLSGIGLLSMNSFFGFSILTGTLSSICCWYFYMFVKGRYQQETKFMALGALYIPSVSFWCSGLSKDMLVYNLVIVLVVLSFKLIKQKKKVLRNLCVISFLSYLLISIRSIIFYSYLASFSIILLLGLVNFLSVSTNVKRVLKLSLILASVLVALNSINLEQGEQDLLASNDYLMQASITQQDFANNQSYGENKYSLGEISFTPTGLLRIALVAVLYGVYSPFLWDELSPTLFFNGVESVFFTYLLILFLLKGFRSKLSFVLSDSFLLYCLMFVIMLAFITGFTSILYGVLVRLRCPLLPLLVFMMDIPNQSIVKNSS